MIKLIWHTFLNTLFPPKCPICRAYVGEQGEWCMACLHHVLSIHTIGIKQHQLKYLDGCQVLCQYRQGIKKIIQQIKFHQALNYLPHIEWLLNKEGDLAYFKEIEIVVPVPLAEARLKKRGFNQSEKIFYHWAKEKGWSWQNSLIRKKDTIPQYDLSPSERQKNIKNAFALALDQEVKHKTILLVDDIFTTGATMDECAKVLKAAGAKKVVGLALATDAAY